VAMEGRELDKRGQASIERMQLVDLAVNLVTGAISGSGPGRVTSVRRGSADRLMPAVPGLPGGRPAAPKPPPQGPGPEPLSYLDIRFQSGITGNIHRRQLTFDDQVRTIYGPVPDWESTLDSDNLAALGPRGIKLNCNKLSVAHVAAPTGTARFVELEAVGNTLIENQSFNAQAPVVRYAEMKGLLILEGDGFTDASLFRRLHPGNPAQEYHARQIQYWLTTGNVQSEGVSPIQFDQPAKRPPAGGRK
jgi:hypothetical protein